MADGVKVEERTAQGQPTPVAVLRRGDELAEVWIGHGFNCLRWQVAGEERLHAAPDWENNPVPTRSGVPVLFPFPNRIRAGTFEYHGRQFTLPLNDSTKANAIHGFAPRRPWRLVGSGTDAAGPWVRGEFRHTVDAADAAGLWPADYVLALTIRLPGRRLRLEAEVQNPDFVPLPFGLGYHPYFRLARAGGDPAGATLCVPAASRWELEGGLPTGRKLPVEGPFDLRQPRPVSGLTLDDAYTDLEGTPGRDGLVLRGQVTWATGEWLELHTGAAFREMVLFTPPHGQAVAVEPYTCVTNAIHGRDLGWGETGWRELRPGGTWSGVVEFRAGG